MKCIIFCFFLFFIGCTSTKNKIRIKQATILVIKYDDIAKLIDLNKSHLELKKNDNLLLLKFEIGYYIGKKSGSLSGGIEPGLDGIEKPINKLEIVNLQHKVYH